MDDFASSLVLSMVSRALKRQGISIKATHAPGSRVVPLAEKQALLKTVLDEHGPDAILGVAKVVPEFGDHPVAGVFANCRSAADAIESWMAIERYFHSRHRTRVLAQHAGTVTMEHLDTRGISISAGESLAVAGLVLGILRWRGAEAARLSFDDKGRTNLWTISWASFESRKTEVTDGDFATMPGIDFAGRGLDNPIVARLFTEQVRTPQSRRTAASSARALGLSLRTLQRRLAQSGWTFGDVVASARVHRAARLLVETRTPLALVGLLAGYSDQPHFQRAFRAAVGPTPGDYRRLAEMR